MGNKKEAFAIIGGAEGPTSVYFRKKLSLKQRLWHTYIYCSIGYLILTGRVIA